MPGREGAKESGAGTHAEGAAGFGAVLPVAGLANSYLDYRLSTEVRGLDGSQARTELNNKAAGALLKSGGMLAAGLGSGGVAFAGMASVIAGNTLQDNGHFQLTDRGAVGIGASSLALMGLGAGANVISGGFEFDAKGHSTSGWSLHGSRGDSVGAGILGSALGGAIGAELGSGLGATLFGQGLGSAFSAYGQKQTGNAAAWEGLLAQDIETTLAGAGGIVHNSISIQKSGGPQGGSFLGNLVNGIAAPFQQLYAMGAYAVSGFQYLFRDAQKESRAALELDSYGGNFDEALDRLMREGHTRNQALSILYGVVLTQRERRADTYGPDGEGAGFGMDPGDSVGEAGNRAWAVLKAAKGNEALGKRDEITRKIEGLVSAGMDLSAATRAALATYEVDMRSVDPAKVQAAYGALMHEVGQRVQQSAGGGPIMVPADTFTEFMHSIGADPGALGNYKPYAPTVNLDFPGFEQRVQQRLAEQVAALDPVDRFRVVYGESVGRAIASMTVGSIPIVGSIQSAVELATGKDYITGHKANRWFAAAGLVFGMLPFGKLALELGAAGRLVHAGLGSTRHFSEARQFFRAAGVTSKDLRNARAAGIDPFQDPWALRPFARGAFFDDMVGNNLGRNFPRIDNMDWANGIAHGTKSLDPRLPTYANEAIGRSGVTAFEKRIDRYFQTLQKYPGQSTPWNNISIDPALINGRARVLDLVVPQQSLRPWQNHILQRLSASYANPIAGNPAVHLNIIPLY